MELKIAICDDEKYYRNYIEKLISQHLRQAGIVFHIETFSAGRDFCEKEENICKYDVIFLDIGMESMNGMDTAYEIRRKNSEMDIVFITVMQDYVFEGYKVGAVRYIMKTELENLLPECLADVLKRRKYRGRMIELPFVGGKRAILLKELLYIESQSHRLRFVKMDETLYMYAQISELEIKLADSDFVRCHQSFLVNMEYISKINNYWIYLSDGTEIPVSRTKYLEVRQVFLRYKEI